MHGIDDRACRRRSRKDAPQTTVVKLIPHEFTLAGAATAQSLILERFDGDHATAQITDAVTVTSSDPAIVKIEAGVATPVANGRATLTATAGDVKAGRSDGDRHGTTPRVELSQPRRVGALEVGL